MNRQMVNRRYRLERKIGEGGAAEVHLGFDIVLNRRVAIKRLRTQYASNRAFRLRFEREAEAAARCSHPNIVSIYDVGEDGQTPYIVMEYIDGQTLREIIDTEGPFHPDDVAVLVEQVAAGLDFAHQRGLVHRDVKPQNILVDHRGLAKIVDFGIAKGLSETALTETGAALGTVHYISPEQASGLMATPESDIYSLGVIAFEMLTGQLPFEADSAVAIAIRHLNDPPPDLVEVNPDIPPEVADVVLQALEKNPTRRYPTAGAFARALTEWRLHDASPRLAARYAPARLDDQRTARIDLLETVPAIRPLEATRSLPTSEPLESPPAPTPASHERRSSSWVFGLAAVVALAAFLWYGFDLAGQLGSGSSNPEVTPTQRAQANVEAGATDTATAGPTRTRETLAATIPDVIGALGADAESALRDRGFNVAYGEQVYSDSVPEGTVVAQRPTGGSDSTRGATVTLVLSSGREPVRLDELRAERRPADEVVDELTSLGLDVVLVDEGSPTVPEGTVIRLEPGGNVQPGDEVSVVVSRGDRVLIPAGLQGEPLARVRGELEELGLTIAEEIPVPEATLRDAGIDDLAASGIADGDVVGVQDNGAEFGGWVDRGSAITLVYYDADLAEPTIGPSS